MMIFWGDQRGELWRSAIIVIMTQLLLALLRDQYVKTVNESGYWKSRGT